MEQKQKTDCRRVTKVDTNIPYEELLMVKQGGFPEEEPVLPAGYSWAANPIDRREEWAAALLELQFVDSIEKAEEQWDRMADEDAERLNSHLYMILDENGKLACSCGIWPGSHFSDSPRLHWVFTVPGYQNLGLARKAVSKALWEFGKNNEAGRIWLSTQAQCWPAILLYESMGFQSYEGDSLRTPASETSGHWKHAREMVWEKEKTKI